MKTLGKVPDTESRVRPVYNKILDWLTRKPSDRLIDVDEPTQGSAWYLSSEVWIDLSPVKIMTESIDHEKTGLLIRAFRRSQGVSVEDLVVQLTIAASYYNKLESGDASWSETTFQLVVTTIREIALKRTMESLPTKSPTD